MRSSAPSIGLPPRMGEQAARVERVDVAPLYFPASDQRCRCVCALVADRMVGMRRARVVPCHMSGVISAAAPPSFAKLQRLPRCYDCADPVRHRRTTEGPMTRVLVLGGGGMLGHKLCQTLGPRFETFATF